MKIRLHDEPAEVKEREITLRLLRVDDSIVVAAVDEDGRPIAQGYLVEFSSSMRLIRRACINEHMGLPLDGYGKLVEGID